MNKNMVHEMMSSVGEMTTSKIQAIEIEGFTVVSP